MNGKLISPEIELRRSCPARLAYFILRGAESPYDLRTIESWAEFLGVSYSSLCECCRLAGAAPKRARDLCRVLRVIQRSQPVGIVISSYLDICDSRTLRAILKMAGLSSNHHLKSITPTSFLLAQSFIPADNAGLQLLIGHFGAQDAKASFNGSDTVCTVPARLGQEEDDQ